MAPACETDWAAWDGHAAAFDASTVFDEYLLLSKRNQPPQARAARRKLREALPARPGAAPRSVRRRRRLVKGRPPLLPSASSGLPPTAAFAVGGGDGDAGAYGPATAGALRSSPSLAASAAAAFSRAVALRDRGGPVVSHGTRQSLDAAAASKVSMANDEFVQFLTRSAGGAPAGGMGGRPPPGPPGWRVEPNRPRVSRWIVRIRRMVRRNGD